MMVEFVKNNQRKIAALVILTIIITTTTIAWKYVDLEREDELVLATTTSTYDSGLLDEIIPDFEKEYNVSVKVTAVGTGQAIELGKRSDVDVLLVHAPELEKEFVNDGYGKYRRDVMYNEYVIAGPQDDPAGLKEVNNATEAFTRIYENRSMFSSRGDDSGTHIKEIELWESAGFDYEDKINTLDSDWYHSLGQGMGDTIRFADEQGSYTLSDEATHISMYDEIEDLEIFVKEDEALFNPYSVIPVSESLESELAEEFADWIITEEVQKMIENYTIEGENLFTPNASRSE